MIIYSLPILTTITLNYKDQIIGCRAFCASHESLCRHRAAVTLEVVVVDGGFPVKFLLRQKIDFASFLKRSLEWALPQKFFNGSLFLHSFYNNITFFLSFVHSFYIFTFCPRSLLHFLSLIFVFSLSLSSVPIFHIFLGFVSVAFSFLLSLSLSVQLVNSLLL